MKSVLRRKGLCRRRVCQEKEYLYRSLTKETDRCLDSIDCCQSTPGTITSSGLGFKLEILTNMTKSTIYLVDHASP
jgi:hypothetical protein